MKSTSPLVHPTKRPVEAMAAGSIDIGWLPGGTYALYSDEVDVILTATRAGLSNDSTDPTTWNGDANKTTPTDTQVTFYRSLIYATPSAYGKELAAKVNAGEALTWDDLNNANWAVLKTSSSAGYIYPTMWLMDNYDGKKLTDLTNVVTLSGYGEAFAQAAAEAVDIIVCYADGRRDYEDAWLLATDQQDATGKAGMGRTDTIWNELNVIGVTAGIYNDTVSITKANEEVYNPEFIAAMQQALINIIGTEEGKPSSPCTATPAMHLPPMRIMTAPVKRWKPCNKQLPIPFRRYGFYRTAFLFCLSHFIVNTPCKCYSRNSKLTSEEAMSMIEFIQTGKTYPNGVQGLKNVNLKIEQGEFVAIIGLSGAGKSTLIRTINRMIDVTEGQVLVDGVDVMTLRGKALRRFRRHIGMIFQSFNLVTRSTVIKNVLTSMVPDMGFFRVAVRHFYQKAGAGRAGCVG